MALGNEGKKLTLIRQDLPLKGRGLQTPPSICSPPVGCLWVFETEKLDPHFWKDCEGTQSALRSHVAYRLKCQRCSSLFIGQTSRLLHTRISENLGISVLTGRKQVNPLPTSILSQYCYTWHPVSPDDVTILSSSSFNSELLVRESLLCLIIRKLNPSLNANMGSFPLSLF